MLNVLAQRRYRQRRREKIAALEAQAKNASASPPQQSGIPHIVPERPLTENPITPDTDPEDMTELPSVSNDYGFQPLNFDTLDMQIFPDDDFSASSSTFLPPSLPNETVTFQPMTPPRSESYSTLSYPMPFGGDANLTVPFLATTNALTKIATLLNCLNCVFDPVYEHTIPAVPHAALPPNLVPTTAQRTIPHHPLLDILPWPSVREKLICIFALPSAVRPPVARDEDGKTGVMRMAYDLEDIPDGLRVHGNLSSWGDGNEMAEEAWEIGGQFFRNWWWCLDSRVLELTNRQRLKRGLGRLRIDGNTAVM